VREDYSETRPSRRRLTERHENWLACGACLMGLLALLAVIILGYYLGRHWLV
jgi:hypothetical protein